MLNRDLHSVARKLLSFKRTGNWYFRRKQNHLSIRRKNKRLPFHFTFSGALERNIKLPFEFSRLPDWTTTPPYLYHPLTIAKSRRFAQLDRGMGMTCHVACAKEGNEMTQDLGGHAIFVAKGLRVCSLWWMLLLLCTHMPHIYKYHFDTLNVFCWWWVFLHGWNLFSPWGIRPCKRLRAHATWHFQLRHIRDFRWTEMR